MTQTLEWIQIKNILARWYAHDLGAPLKYVMNSCYISIVEEHQRHVCCKQAVLRYKTLYLLIMPTERHRENERPIHTSHTCATYPSMHTCWSIYDIRACRNKLLKTIRFRCDNCRLSNIGLRYIQYFWWMVYTCILVRQTVLIFLVSGIYLQRSLNHINQAWTFANIQQLVANKCNA